MNWISSAMLCMITVFIVTSDHRRTSMRFQTAGSIDIAPEIFDRNQTLYTLVTLTLETKSDTTKDASNKAPAPRLVTVKQAPSDLAGIRKDTAVNREETILHRMLLDQE
jgi:uncharacterized protein YueI